MVEGPKVILKAEKFSHLLTNVLKVIEFTTINAESLYEKTLSRVTSVGKELFLQFDNCPLSIRLHFQMSGKERIVKSGILIGTSAQNSRSVLTAVLRFDKHDVYIYDSSISVKTTEYIRVVEQRRCRDICSDQFSLQETVQLLKADCRPIQEAIMDQQILPGVGNIIKCEGLFLSRTNPCHISSELDIETLSDVVANLHVFALKWLSHCRVHKSVTMAVYNLNTCLVCSATIRLVRANASGRITYYCANCQPLSTAPATRPATTTIAAASNAVSKEEGSSVERNQWIDLFDMQKCKCVGSLQALLMRVRKLGATHDRLLPLSLLYSTLMISFTIYHS